MTADPCDAWLMNTIASKDHTICPAATSSWQAETVITATPEVSPNPLRSLRPRGMAAAIRGRQKSRVRHPLLAIDGIRLRDRPCSAGPQAVGLRVGHCDTVAHGELDWPRAEVRLTQVGPMLSGWAAH